MCCAFREESQTKTSGSCWVKQERSWGRNKWKGAAGCECGNQKIAGGKHLEGMKRRGEGHKGNEQSTWNEELKEMGKLDPSVKQRTLPPRTQRVTIQILALSCLQELPVLVLRTLCNPRQIKTPLPQEVFFGLFLSSCLSLDKPLQTAN